MQQGTVAGDNTYFMLCFDGFNKGKIYIVASCAYFKGEVCFQNNIYIYIYAALDAEYK
jgi:hypothetical protein